MLEDQEAFDYNAFRNRLRLVDHGVITEVKREIDRCLDENRSEGE